MNSPRKFRGLVALVVIIASLAITANAQTRWVGSWAASQQLVEPHNSISADDLKDVTLRQIVHLSIGGSRLRLHLSNRYGVTALYIASVHIATPVSPDSSKIVPNSDREVMFSGREDVTIPAGADYVSDVLADAEAPLSDVAITLRLADVPAEQTGHPGSRSTSYLVHGDQVSAVELSNPKLIEHWYFIAGIDVSVPEQGKAVVTLGDSITDGHGATTNGNDRWPDILARRLQAVPRDRNIAVLNQGIGGNRLLLNGLGPNVLARFDHDVLAQAGVSYLIVLEGVNDLGMFGRTVEHSPAEHHELVNEIIAAYQQVIVRAHTHGIKVAGCTILPFVGSSFYHPDAAGEADRQAVNDWIRIPGHFDAVIDFDKIMRDPASPDRLLPKFDSGDHLHPSPAGYAEMANTIPLALLTQSTAPLQSNAAPAAKAMTHRK
jgi:lysophospholipase L1-like esterase